METENVTSPAGEVAQETAAIPQDEPRDDNERADAANQQAEGVETETNEDGEEVATEEFELDVAGTKHKFPKGTPIEEALEKVQAYSKGLEAKLTRESQSIAEKSKAVAEAEKVVARLQNLGFEKARDLARGEQLANYVAQYETPQAQAQLNALWTSNPDEARRISDSLVQARSEYASIESRIAQYGQQLNEAERQAVEVRSREGEAAVTKAIKGWNSQIESEVVAYAIKEGVRPEHAKTWRLNPYATITTWKALQFDKMQAKAKSAAQPIPVPAPKAPVTSVKGGKVAASSTPDLEKMPMDEYAAYMRKREGRGSR